GGRGCGDRGRDRREYREEKRVSGIFKPSGMHRGSGCGGGFFHREGGRRTAGLLRGKEASGGSLYHRAFKEADREASGDGREDGGIEVREYVPWRESSDESSEKRRRRSGRGRL